MVQQSALSGDAHALCRQQSRVLVDFNFVRLPSATTNSAANTFHERLVTGAWLESWTSGGPM